MTYIDFHTHHPAPDGCFAWQQGVQTQGIHPWCAKEDDITFYPTGDVLAIGECGLDKLCATPYDLQKEIFIHHIRLSESLRRPLLIHCVKALDDLLLLRRTYAPLQPWMVHGFRGKPQQLTTLIGSGFYVSFGRKYNEESLLSCPLNMMLLETDDDLCDIALLYADVARKRNVSLEALVEQMWENACALNENISLGGGRNAGKS